MRWVNLLFVLAINAVPLYGVWYKGWSASTVVVLYWFENLMIAFFTCGRIWLHRTLTRKRGHWRGGTLGVQSNGKPVTSGLLGEYATLAFVFTLAHGIFVAGFVAIAADHGSGPEWKFSREQFMAGAQWLLIAMTLEFLSDAATMRSRNFAWIKAYVGQRTGRVLVMHFVIILGMGAMMLTESPFAMLYALIGLKTLWDLFASNASARPEALPEQPPELALKIAAQQKGITREKVIANWKQQREDMIRAAQEDEEIVPA